MSRAKNKSIDQIEAEETFTFRTRDAKEPESEDAPKQDKRTEPKEFLLARDQTGLYYIKLSAGGEVPDVLKGRFTNIVRAQAAIDNVLADRKQKESQ